MSQGVRNARNKQSSVQVRSSPQEGQKRHRKVGTRGNRKDKVDRRVTSKVQEKQVVRARSTRSDDGKVVSRTRSAKRAATSAGARSAPGTVEDTWPFSPEEQVHKKTLNAKIVEAPRYKHVDLETGAMILGPLQPDVSIKDAISHAMKRIGGADGLAEWASLNPNAFYTSVMPKLLPVEVVGKDGGPIEFTIVDPTTQVIERDVTPQPAPVALQAPQAGQHAQPRKRK